MAEAARSPTARRIGPARLAYRLRQGLHALRPRLHHDGLSQVPDALLPAEQRLFAAMEKRDQRHALAVLTRLRDRGVTDRDLLGAALLHDCGKGAVPIWLRSLNVVAPALVLALAREQAAGVRASAFRLRHHPDLGAALCAAAGSREATVRFIAGRVRPGEEAKMELLKAADDAS